MGYSMKLMALRGFCDRSPRLLESEVLFGHSFEVLSASGSPVEAFQLIIEDFRLD